MPSTAVISDLHGDVSLLRGVLELIGATDKNGVRQQGWTLYQVGDAVNRCRYPYYIKVPPEATKQQRAMMTLAEQARDFACLEECAHLLDGIAMGNHEGADFGMVSHNDYDATAGPIRDLVHRLFRQDFMRAAFHVGDWLVTHSGLNPRFWDDDDDGVPVRGQSAAQIAEALSDGMTEAFANPPAQRFSPFWAPGVYSAVSERRWAGPFRLMFKEGGILWGDWAELREDYRDEFGGEASDDALKQIVGHTTQPKGPRKDELYPLVNIDVGAKHFNSVCAAVTHDGGKTWETHVYRNPLKV